MTQPQSNENLEEIVRLGASRPLRRWLITAILLVLILGGAWFYFANRKNGSEKAEYVTEPARMGGISLIVTAAGSLAPTNQVVIGSELSGTIKELYVDTNDMVKKGQALAKLDTTKLNQQSDRSRAALTSAKAKVNLAEATLAESKAALARQEELRELSGGKTPSRATMETSRATVSRALADLDSTKAAVAGAEADVRSFERDLQISVIASPVDGVVLSRSIDVGQTVAASFTAPTLFTIAEDLRKMKLLVSVSESDIGRVEAGQTASFSVDAWPGRTYTAKVRKVAFGAMNTATTAAANNAAAATTNGVVNYSTELVVANEDLSLRPGMTASVDIAIVERKNIIVVPNSALRFDPDVAAEIGKPDETKRTLVQSLSLSGRRWHGAPPPKSGSTSKEPHVWALKDGEPAKIMVKPGISDGRVTEITGDSLTKDTPVIVSVKPAKSE